VDHTDEMIISYSAQKNHQKGPIIHLPYGGLKTTWYNTTNLGYLKLVVSDLDTAISSVAADNSTWKRKVENNK
jgi:hypothetical protein